MANPKENDRLQNVLHAYWILSTQAKLMRRFAGEIRREELSGDVVSYRSWLEAFQMKLMQRFPEEFSREELDEIKLSPVRFGGRYKELVRISRKPATELNLTLAVLGESRAATFIGSAFAPVLTRSSFSAVQRAANTAVAPLRSVLL